MDDRYDPNLILAYVEGGLDDAGRARFEQQCAADPSLRKLADQLRADCEAVRGLPRAEPSSPSSESAMAMMERDLLLGDEPLGSVGVAAATASAKGPAAGHRVLRLVAYVGVAAAVALTGAVVVQNLTDTRLLERARELSQSSIAVEPALPAKDDGMVLADATPAAASAPGSGSGSELSSKSRVAGDASMAASVPSPAVAAAKMSKPARNAPLAEADGAEFGGMAGMVGDAVLADAGRENDADTAANAAMTIEETVDNVPALALAAAELPELPPTYGFMADINPATEGAAEVPKYAVQTLAIHTAEPARLGREVAAWVTSNGGVVLVLAEQKALDAPREDRLFSRVVRSAAQRPQAPAPGSGSGNGSGRASVATQQLEVLIPSGQVADFYSHIGQEVPASITPDETTADALFAMSSRDAEAALVDGFLVGGVEESGKQKFVRRERSFEQSSPVQVQVGQRFLSGVKAPADLYRQSLLVKEANADDSSGDAYGWQQPAHWLPLRPAHSHPLGNLSSKVSSVPLDSAPRPAVHIRLLIAPAAE